MSIAPGQGPHTGMRSWRTATATPRLSRDAAARQGQITHLAFQLLGGRDAALACLNSDDAALGARPIDLAIASTDGFAVVEQAIRRVAAAA